MSFTPFAGSSRDLPNSSRRPKLTWAVLEALEQRRLLNALTFASAVNVTVNEPSSVTIADYNGDGKPDIVVADANGMISLLQGNEDGTFQPAQTMSDGLANGPAFVVVANVDSSLNHPDLIAVSEGGDSVSVLLGAGNGHFQRAQTYVATSGADIYSVAVTDVNGDGKPDIITGNDDGTLSELLGNGDGTFRAYTPVPLPSGSGNITVAAGHLVANGPLILAAANSLSNNLTILQSQGNGTFTTTGTYSTGDQPDSVAIGDLIANGNSDVVVGDDDGSVTVLLGNGNGSFQVPTTLSNVATNIDSVAIADMDQDGSPDIVVAGDIAPNSGGVKVLFGNGTGQFSAVASNSSFVLTTSSPLPRAAIADLNGDGIPDVVTTNYLANSVSAQLNLPASSGSTGTPTFITTPDSIIATGTPSNDTCTVSEYNSQVIITIDSTSRSFAANSGKTIQIKLGAGNDSVQIEAGAPAIIVKGEAGNDTITASNSAPDTLNGNMGNDSILGGGAVTLPGGGNDLIDGGPGNDTLFGGSGNSTVYGNGGTDSITGGRGNGLLLGGEGNDTILAGSGTNILGGNEGNDSLTGSSGAEVLRGGPGNDTLVAGATLLFSSSSANSNTLRAGSGADSLVGAAGANDLLLSGSGSDTLVGAISTTGTDTLVGGGGAPDSIQGGARDSIISVAGDTVTGGANFS